MQNKQKKQKQNKKTVKQYNSYSYKYYYHQIGHTQGLTPLSTLIHSN